MALSSIRVKPDSRDKINQYAEQQGMSAGQFVDYLISLHENKVKRAKTAISKEGSEWKDRNRGALSANQKLELFFDMLMKHNTEQRELKEEGIYLHHKSLNFVSVELGMNKTRDVSPFIKAKAELLNSHYEGGRGKHPITKEVMKNGVYAEKDEKGRSVYITELMRKYKIADAFGR